LLFIETCALSIEHSFVFPARRAAAVAQSGVSLVVPVVAHADEDGGNRKCGTAPEAVMFFEKQKFKNWESGNAGHAS
jgi:hypothetical protein